MIPFCRVKKATHSVTGEKVALKIIDKAKATKRTLSQLHTEIMALKTLNHPNILQLFHVEVEAMYPKKNGDQVRWWTKWGQGDGGIT